MPFERILKKAGAKRVSQSSLDQFAAIMEEKMNKISVEAIILAKHAGRKTINIDDVRMAKRKLYYNF